LEVIATVVSTAHLIVCKEISYPSRLFMLLAVEQGKAGIVLNLGRIFTVG
jgi:hypothetical protein